MKETRTLAAEFRATTEGETRTITGYAAKFDVVSKVIPGRKGKDEPREFREVIRPGAINLAESTDVICTVDHNFDKLLGRSVSGTLRMSVDEAGLRFDDDLPPTSAGDEAYSLVGRGDLRGCSFGFQVLEGGETWSRDADGMPLRELTNIAVVEIGIVIDPAYPGTEVALRSLERFLESEQQPSAPLSVRIAQLNAASKF